MRILRRAPEVLALLFCSAASFSACGGGLEEDVAASGEQSLRARSHCTSDAQCHPPQRCAGGTCKDPAPHPGPGADPPPAQCDRRHAGATAIEAVVRIDRYRGLSRGRNGTHEVAFGAITSTPWVFDAAMIDTAHVELALNVASNTDPAGLPDEVRLVPGESILVEGEYIPASRANVRGERVPTAVIHYTHAPCGFVVIKGRKYR
jgi:hypothetical protein